MGYNTYITGDLTITPQISPKDEHAFERFKIDSGANEGYFTITHKDGDEDVQVVNGVITVVGKTAGVTQFHFGVDESFKAYSFDADIQMLVDAAQSLGYRVNGEFDGDGEESDDFWRIRIVDNSVTTENGSILFPSDQYVELERIGRDKMNHGWVIPRPDGAVAKCGGPMTCPACKDERAWLSKQIYGTP